MNTIKVQAKKLIMKTMDDIRNSKGILKNIRKKLKKINSKN